MNRGEVIIRNTDSVSILLTANGSEATYKRRSDGAAILVSHNHSYEHLSIHTKVRWRATAMAELDMMADAKRARRSA